MEELQIRVQSEPWSFGVGVLIRKGSAVVRPEDCVFTSGEPDIIIDPTLHIDSNAAQLLMDDLWNAGYRPSEGTGSAGSLKATERHLEDMRKLVFERGLE